MFVSPNSRRLPCSGFTLLELLVIISIIVILASMLIPAVVLAKDHAQTVRCSSNLRQIGIAMGLYVDDNKCYPLATSDGITGAWQKAIEPLPDAVYYCPVLRTPSPTFVQIFNWTGGSVSPHYGYNVMGAAYQGSPPCNPGLGGDINLATGGRTPTCATKIANPSQLVVAGDSATFIDVIFGAQPQSSIPNQIYLAFPYPVPRFNLVGVGSWHNTNANMVFGDGHVQRASQQYWIAATDQSRRLWNSDNQPHEEWW